MLVGGFKLSNRGALHLKQSSFLEPYITFGSQLPGAMLIFSVSLRTMKRFSFQFHLKKGKRGYKKV